MIAKRAPRVPFSRIYGMSQTDLGITPEGGNRKMLKIGIIKDSTRQGRKAAAVAKWVHDILKSRKDAEFEIVDIADYKLTLLDEPGSPTMHKYSKQHTKTWNEN